MGRRTVVGVGSELSQYYVRAVLARAGCGGRGGLEDGRTGSTQQGPLATALGCALQLSLLP